jgi:broad specificity phosphatase PhoE
MIYLLRHGEIQTGGVKRFVGQQDLPLSPRGVRQARWWQEKFSALRFTVIFSSDLERTIRTAEIIAEPHKIAPRMVPEFREIDLGAWTGCAISDIRKAFPGAWRQRGQHMATYRPPGGECFNDLYRRVVPLFEKISGTTEGDILIVAHSGVNRVILGHVLGLNRDHLLRFGQDYAALNKIGGQTPDFTVAAMNVMPDPDPV